MRLNSFRLKELDPSIKVLMTPLIIIISSVVLVIVIINIGYPHVTRRLAEINEAKKVQNTLEERLSILREFNQGALDDKSGVTFTVLPDNNPGAAMFSQVKNTAIYHGITVQNIEFVGATDFQNGIKKSDLIFDLESPDITSVLKFLFSISIASPISTVEDVEMERDEGVFITKLKYSLYWAELPSALPSITEPLVNLSQEELQDLAKIQTFILPQFTNLFPKTEQQERPNPFN